MGKITWGFVIFALLSIIAYIVLVNVKENSEITYDYDDFSIQIHRHECEIVCPSYTFTVYDNGTIKFEGGAVIDDRFLNHEYSVSKEKAALFLSNLEEIEYIRNVEKHNSASQKEHLESYIILESHGKTFSFYFSDTVESDFNTDVSKFVISTEKSLDISQFFDLQLYDNTE